MVMSVKRLVTTKGRDENIVEMVTFPCNEDEIATWFHVNELDELQFAGGSASDLTVPEFNQVMQEADGRIQKIESNINAAVRFLEAKLRDNPEQKKFPKWSGWGLRMRQYGSSVCRTVTVRRMSMSSFLFPAYSCK